MSASTRRCAELERLAFCIPGKSDTQCCLRADSRGTLAESLLSGLKMANDTSPAELTAFEGPDDWVSLYLDGVGEDVLADSEVCISGKTSVEKLSTLVNNLTVLSSGSAVFRHTFNAPNGQRRCKHGCRTPCTQDSC